MLYARSLLAALFAVGSLTATLPQLPPPAKATAPPAQRPGQSPEDPRVVIRSRVELVVVPVTVKGSDGELISDILPQEFRIFEDAVEQQIELFSADPFPLSVALLIDNDLEQKTAEQLKRALPSLAAGISEFDEVAVLYYDEYPRVLLEFTRDNDRLYDHLKRYEPAGRFPGIGSGPMTAGPRVNQQTQEAKVPTRVPARGRAVKNLDDAIYAAAQILRGRDRERRKIIFLISDGTNSPNNEVSYDDALKLLLSYDISVYAIGVGNVALGRAFNPLSRYARATGGDVFYATSLAELESLFSRVTEQARNQYTLAYTPRGTDRSREYHEIEVRVRRPGLDIRARDGYFSVPLP